MNIKEFSEYRTKCPCCNSKLDIRFGFSGRRKDKNIRYINGRLCFLFILDTLNKNKFNRSFNRSNKKYQVAYSFMIEDNSIQIEFYGEHETNPCYEDIPDFLHQRFLDFHRNIRSFFFYKSCVFCCKYSYYSDYFTIDLKKNYIPQIFIKEEDIILNDVNNTYRISNDYLDKETIIYIWNHHDDSYQLGKQNVSRIVRKAISVQNQAFHRVSLIPISSDKNINIEYIKNILPFL